MLEQYPAGVKLVHKDGPLQDNPLARSAAIAALAAGEQKKYWEYHDKIMQSKSAEGPEKYLEFAKELGLDMAAFQKSLADPKHGKHIDKDTQDAHNAGVQGMPTIFVNGRLVINRTPEALNAMISEELQKKKK